MSANKPQPTALNARTQSRLLEISFDDGRQFSLPFELLRVYSPSAEVKGHGPGQEVLQTGKRDVGLVGIEPVGNYAVKPIFSDEHSSGIFTWEYLYWLGDNQEVLWGDYLAKLQQAGHPGDTGRDAPMLAKSGGACGHHH
ncbi:gamma-butyrobetaine hydroxylase-like domain-containing protein [Undibacterium sp. SXout7W]|uniref:gamma-butyrobetaine hydroxylase-like domain-containing protein n=1 Tax=Undibacterium sp. SXout7W TaxID=3413049 RepID=UPI003BF0CAD9